MLVLTACVNISSARLKADNPLADDEAFKCMSLTINDKVDAVIAGRSPDAGLALIEARMSEYGGEAPVASMTPEQQMNYIIKVGRQLGQDADMAMLCRAALAAE